MNYTAYLHNLEDNCRLHLSSKDSDNRNGQNTDCLGEHLDTQGRQDCPEEGFP